MRVLALDTALDACSAAVVEDGRPLAVRSQSMARGHQERLAPMVQAVMAEAGLAFSALDRLGLTVGPGSFTGVRVGLAFARSMALALGIPCVGIGTLEALAGGQAGMVVAAIDARREQLYLQAFRDAEPLAAPSVVSLDDARQTVAALIEEGPVRLLGSGARLLLGALPDAEVDARPAPDPVAVALLATARPPPEAPPTPLYLRAADAKTLAERGFAAP